MCRSTVPSALALLSLCACGSELKLGSTVGLKPIQGETAITLAFEPACDRVDCKVTFSRAVVIATKQDYAKDLAGLLKAVDLDVRTLTFVDDDRDVVLTPQERLRSGAVTIADELTLGRQELSELPTTLRLEGPVLDELRAQIRAGEPALLMVRAELVVTPPLPTHLLVKYDVQPVLVLGPK